MKEVNIIGGGLAGCESAYQLAKRGIKVNLYDMKPKFTPAHKNENLGELVCSNSLKSNDITTAGGLLKEELRKLDSLLIKIADETRVPAGNSLSVDRNLFAERITCFLENMDNVSIIRKEITNIDINFPTIIATGPLTSDEMSKSIAKLLGTDGLYFFDAIAPIVAYDSINFDIAYIKDRYDKGDGDYINLPFNKEEYLNFYNELINGEIVKLKDFENSKVYEGCMPIEVLAKRGEDAIRFGPLKPVGLKDPRTDKTPYAVVQLRKESFINDYYNMVGFQTNLTYPEQKRIFRLIPGLENAEFLRLGTMHKNTYINSPGVLKETFQMINYSNIFFAGQISGVEGYVESIASGLVAGINMFAYLNNLDEITFDKQTIIGALCKYIAYKTGEFQPMSANMGLINYDEIRMKDKKEKNLYLANRSLNLIELLKDKEKYIWN
ncbi:MAG: methylenetetrahydrofolate--tRNA-(uracil(54)-C(5))-methyltransferase (FADH(2)-oxidizing) TrmFO [Clostridiales bacterium]|nr:methylenetetrahydrofolate--tRNA-(uracil(54)-C(5))-methyltransferase (FADH(2)-oxidizing) TrmFO [Clostridiales bacterium]